MIFRNPHFPALPRPFAPSRLFPHPPGHNLPSRPAGGGISTIALFPRSAGKVGPAFLRAVHRGRREVTAYLRQSGLPQHWRFLVLLTLLSFAAAWMGTKAVMAQFESSWTAAALTVARHENQELRTRQETLRAKTEAALADLAAVESHSPATPAGYP